MFSEAVRPTETFIPPPRMRPIVSISRDMDTVKSTLRVGRSWRKAKALKPGKGPELQGYGLLFAFRK